MNRTAVLACAMNLLVCVGVVRADVVLDWNAVMQSTVAGQNPFAQARFAAIDVAPISQAAN